MTQQQGHLRATGTPHATGSRRGATRPRRTEHPGRPEARTHTQGDRAVHSVAGVGMSASRGDGGRPRRLRPKPTC
eukprot:scaffold3377_cov105-Isochrysis_galbana.AAC.6